MRLLPSLRQGHRDDEVAGSEILPLLVSVVSPPSGREGASQRGRVSVLRARVRLSGGSRDRTARHSVSLVREKEREKEERGRERKRRKGAIKVKAQPCSFLLFLTSTEKTREKNLLLSLLQGPPPSPAGRVPGLALSQIGRSLRSLRLPGLRKAGEKSKALVDLQRALHFCGESFFFFFRGR